VSSRSWRTAIPTIYAVRRGRHGAEGALRDAADILPRDSIFCLSARLRKGSYSAFSNVFRYQLVLDRGGWWVDTDLVCLKAFDFDDEFVFATERERISHC
jgi:hypothetical protein